MLVPPAPQELDRAAAGTWLRWHALLSSIRTFSPSAFVRSPTVILLLAGLILPNLLSLASLASFIDVGLPPRTGCIIFYATLAICARRLPFVVTGILFVVVLGFDLIWTLALMFGLAPSELLVALNHAKRIHFFASPLYMSL